VDKKPKIALVFGGMSAEHEISVQSAKSIYHAINKEKYKLFLIWIDKEGAWHLVKDDKVNFYDWMPSQQNKGRKIITVSLVKGSDFVSIINMSNFSYITDIDLFFPILHGPNGEDGSMQGLLKFYNIPFVGSGILGSAICMDKDVMKRLLRDANLPITDFLVLNRKEKISYTDISHELGNIVFVKPANMGSSVGISKVSNEEEYNLAIRKAFEYDKKIILESCVEGRELECAVLGNQEPMASKPGEIITKKFFYTYEAKYEDMNSTILQIPANLDEKIISDIQNISIKSYKTLCCEVMARVDLFLTKQNNVIINEINTIPGFTKMSMYPKLWEVSGIPYHELIDKLIDLAIERFKSEKDLSCSE